MTVTRGSWLVFDVGGTSSRAAIFEPESRTIRNRTTVPTPNLYSMPGADQEHIQAAMLATLGRLGETVCPAETPEVVSLALPGPVDHHGRLLTAPTVWGPGRRPFAASDVFADRWPGAELHVLNDLTAAGYRHAVDQPDFCLVTISSGIGHKVFIDGRPIVGPHGFGGELGHFRVDPAPDAVPCDCGGRGHLGAVSSGRGLEALARRRAAEDPRRFAGSLLNDRCQVPSKIENDALAWAFGAGDAWAVELVRAGTRPLASVLACVHLTLGLERFIVVGGLALGLGEPFRLLLAEEAERCAWEYSGDWAQMITLGTADGQDGLVGAGIFALTAGSGNRLEVTG